VAQPADLGFTIAPEALALGLSGVYLVIGGLENRATDPAFDALIDAELPALRERYAAPEFIKTDPVLAGFRELHTRVGRSNRRFVASPEALLGRFQRTGVLPRVNLLVDLYNFVSLKTRLALGAHDVAQIAGDVCLRLTDGSEGFHPLGAAAPEPVFPGEYAYCDAANDVLCRMEVLQVEKTKVTEATTAAFYIVQGNMNTPSTVLHAAVEELVALTTRFCGGSARLLYTPA
jgi:DNA/RNA-binding domain of Phe-tRNA-synthetase-like protein